MIPPSAIRLCIVCMQILALLVLAPADLFAIQIAPNPNPDGNTITIVPSTPGENLVPFTNLGIINIETAASLHNGSRLDNSGGIISAGAITNSDVFTNNRVVNLLEGSQFNNLASGLYSGVQGSIHINGTFVNEGAVEHGLGHIVVEERGQYIQRQSVGSSVTPTTFSPDAPFTNAGRVHIAAGDFIINPISVHAASATYDQSSTGTTQIDGRFFNVGGQVRNAGAITIGATGEYRQQGRVSAFLDRSTSNTGIFTNAGTTNIGTGVFTNQGSVVNTGTVTVEHTGGQYIQESAPGRSAPTTNNSGSFSNAGQVRIGEGTSFSNFSNRTPPVGQYIQQASGITQIYGTFQVGGARVENAGAMTVGTTGTYLQAFNKFVPVESTTVNTGTFTNAGNTLVNAGTFTNQGSLVNSGTFQIAANGAGTLINQGTMVNAGTIEVGTLGQVTGTGSYVQNAAAAQTIVNGTFAHNINLQAGSLSGAGTITGAVINMGGVVQPGNSIAPGTLTLANYTQGIYGRLDLKIGGLLAGSQYDVLKVTGPGAFGGSLSVRLINGFTPGLGNTFSLLACSLGCAGLNSGTLFGGGVSLPSLASGLAWFSGLTDGGNSFSLTVVAAVASAPEPGMLLLVGSGFLGLIWWRRRQQGRAIGR